MITDKDGKRWKLVPDHMDMTDDQAEAVALGIGVCGGMAYDSYRLSLAAAPAFEPGDELVEEVARALHWEECSPLGIRYDEESGSTKRYWEKSARAALSVIGRKG
jgi:hypothetical protein